jgi:hypothetical protein
MELLVAGLDRSERIDDIKAGQVIDVHPDGWGWSEAELSNPNWHVISAPILPTHVATLMQQHSFGQRVRGNQYPQTAHLLNLPALGLGPTRTVKIVALSNEQMVNATIKVA